MKKLLIPALIAVAVVISVIAQSNPNGIPTPDESRWPAGIYNYSITSGTNGTISNAGRQGYAAIGVDSTSLTVTNAGVTTNSYIVASLANLGGSVAAGDLTNTWITAITPASGTFSVHLRQPPTSNAVVRWLILNY